MKARSFGVALALVTALGFGGCNLVGDEYVETTLAEVLNGSVRSPQSRYRIPAPHLAAVRKNTGIIREDSIFLVIVGPDLKSSVKAVDPGRAQYGVRLRKEPRTHVVLERIWRGENEVNLFEGDRVLRAEFPDFIGSSEVPYADYRSDVTLERIGPDDDMLAELPKNRLLAAGLTIERRTLAGPTAELALATDPTLNVKRPQYVLRAEGLDWIVVKSDVPTNLMLDFFVSEKRHFKGGVVVLAVFHPDTRRDSGVGGLVRVRWMDLGGTLFYKAR